jgi:hypothetical protein
MYSLEGRDTQGLTWFTCTIRYTFTFIVRRSRVDVIGLDLRTILLAIYFPGVFFFCSIYTCSFTAFYHCVSYTNTKYNVNYNSTLHMIMILTFLCIMQKGFHIFDNFPN